MIRCGLKPLNKFNRVEFKIGEEFVLLGRTYRCVRDYDDCLGVLWGGFCGKCQLPTCSTDIACASSEREDGNSVQFELVVEGGDK